MPEWDRWASGSFTLLHISAVARKFDTQLRFTGLRRSNRNPLVIDCTR